MKKIVVIMCVLSIVMSVPAMASAPKGAAMTYVPDNESAPVMVTTFEVTPQMMDTSPAGTYTYVPENPEAPMVTIYNGDSNIPVPLSGDVTHISNVHHTGNDDFTDTFTCTASDGNRLNIFVRNNGQGTVIVNITWKKFLSQEHYPAINVDPGDHTIQTYSYDNNKGIDGTWTVNVTRADGKEMDINVAARQYQIN